MWLLLHFTTRYPPRNLPLDCDASGSQVDGEFRNGKLVQWQLLRPAQPDASTDAAVKLPTP